MKKTRTPTSPNSRRMRSPGLVLAALLAPAVLYGVEPAAETSEAAPATATVAPPVRRQWDFPSQGVTFDARFDGARLDECAEMGAGEFSAVIRPENEPINNSAWFAFKVASAAARPIIVRLRIEGGTVRYRPKISVDGRHWVTLPLGAFESGPARNEGVLRLETGPQPLWVAAQEPVSSKDIEAWCGTMERLPFVTRSTFGRSVLGRPLVQLDIGNPAAVHHVILIGRQHPPETTGSLALMRFVEEIAGDSELARRFREEIHVLVMPLLNPDGIDRGHWRHNMHGVDLNRDWDEFRQPETRAASRRILSLRGKGRLLLHLDFHSTVRDAFYTQPDDAPSSPPGFTKNWLAGIQARFPDYAVNRSASLTPKPNTSAHWAHRTFGIPAITCETGDDTDRALVRRIAAGAAQEMMQLLLDAVADTVAPATTPGAAPPQ